MCFKFLVVAIFPIGTEIFLANGGKVKTNANIALLV